MAFSYKSHAQSLGDPLVHITFGSGSNQFAGALPADSGSTDYGYVDKSPEDNYYTIANSTLGMNAGWVYTTDHTGDPNGYMMVVNASYTPGLFYMRTVPGLCGGTTYQFSAWIKNILKTGGILPNVTFTIETTGGTILGTGNTGDIPVNNTWTEYSFTFSTPANTQAIVLKIINNAPGGYGNDLAIDDIYFRPYGTTFSSVFANGKSNFCEGISETTTITSVTPLDPNYAQKLQQKINGVWVDKSPAGTATAFSFPTSIVAGIYPYRIVKSDMSNINTSACVVSSNVLNVTVLALPTAAMQVADNTCQSYPTVFTDQSIAPGSAVASWLWDFGDGQTSTQQSPSHLYTNPGDYTVKLTVSNGGGCTSPTISKTIHIIPQVNIAFNYSAPDCETQAITFTDASTSTEGNIISHMWDFGDNTPVVTRTDNAPFQHTFAAANSYPVKLTTTTDKGCVSTLTKTVKVNPLPVVDFIVPKVCLDDAYAQFTDNTTIADNSGNFTYLWDFGDDNATAANPNTSILQNPKHAYKEAKLYKVTLTVTSANGCPTTMSKFFLVNGRNPVADFEVLNPTTLCSDHEVLFVDKSTVGFGNINKVVMDYGDGTPPETDDYPSSGKIYSHKYPTFSTVTTKNYTIQMVAYSGGICFSEMDKPITLLPVSTLTFNAPDAVCLNSGPLQLDAKDISGIPGSGVYIGTGVSSTGLFDPLAAGVGTFTITYTYTTNAGCQNTIQHAIMVKPIPTVNAGPDVTILSGQSTPLHAVASGDNITYSWFPTTGLSSSTIANPIATLTSSNITYTLTVTNEEGCSVTDDITVTVLQAIVIPNAFTPNNDGINDKWDIKYLDGYTGCTIDVFNRNGQKVYSSVGYTSPWDGTTQKGELPFGVYYYIIDPKHGREPVSGYVTIIR